MTTHEKPNMDNTRSNEANNIDFIDILIILKKNKFKLVFIPAIFSFFGFLISLSIPNIYRANTKLLPPQQSQSTASAMLSQLGGLAGGAGAALGIKNHNDLYIALLKSRTLTDKLIERFDLKSRYNNASQESTRNQLINNSIIVSGKDGIISIDVDDKDRKVSAEIANAYVEELAILTNKFALTEAAQRRVFYEKQLDIAKNKMIAAESLLSTNIPNTGLVSIDSQSKAVLETTAKLRANISSKEIQLKAMQAFVTPNNAQFKRIFQELNGMREELAKLESGSGSENNPNSKNNINQNIDSNSSTNSGANNFQILRDVKYYQMLYEMLAKQFEIARLDESKDAPIIQVLDKAIEPENKYKPKRIIIVFGGFFLGIIAALTNIFFSEKIINLIPKEKRKKFIELRNK